MEDIVLESKDAVDWSYRGEGSVNLVLAYTGSSPTFKGKLLRIPKIPKAEDGNGLTTHEKIIWAEFEELVSSKNQEMLEYLFVKHVMRPLLGHKHVNPGMLVGVSKEFLECVQKSVTSQGPVWRAEVATVDTTRSSVLLMDDFTLFDQGDVENNPSLCVEIKPKCGFLPSSSFLSEIKKSVTNFEMQQILRLKENKVSDFSDYNPLDLFSGSKDRILNAIKDLYMSPQRNFRVFLNGRLVFGNLGGVTIKTTSKVEQDFEHVLKDIIRTEDEGVRANHFLELVAETVYASGVLDQLLEVQKLDKYDIEGAIHVYYDVTEQPCNVCRELEMSNNNLSNEFSSLHSLPLDEKVKILKDFIIALIAKDCSIMISFRTTEAGVSRSSAYSTVNLESTKQEFEYKVHFVDLDMRPLKKMETYYYPRDQKIVQLYLEMLKKKQESGGETEKAC